MAQSMWTSDRRLYLNAAGEVVEANNPDRAKLLVGVGGQIPIADAERHGLITVEPEQIKAVEAPKANKAAAPKANKGE